ncbi:hypothetical protein EGM51_07010 [Verrucomicrobia bacterium S94]|nr:hypothetical protein EGM51_07010 [Verrucomicrobia bacterium S94]
MKRRNVLAFGTAAGGGACLLTLTTAFKTDVQAQEKPHKLEPENPETEWGYAPLTADDTGRLAYNGYAEGSCMFAVANSIIKQLAERFGEPYTSFPIHMMKYGHGGVGGYGTVCGALNGAAAMIGLVVSSKKDQNALITDLFRWYEQSRLPVYTPETAQLDYTPESSTAASALCHASVTNWCKASGHGANSKQRKERCSRLSADVAIQVSSMLNRYFDCEYETPMFSGETSNSCLTCHGKESKLENTSGQMNCTSCHTKSIGHRLFADVHYKCIGETE